MDSTPSPSDLPTTPYIPPTSGILSLLPASWVPYAELLRLDKPTGTWYLFLPCLFGTLLAGAATEPVTAPAAVAGTGALFLAGALVMRGAGCAVNDLWDRDLDPRVRRTRLRPLARRAVTPRRGLALVGASLLAGLAVLLRFPPACLVYGVPSLLLVAAYPLAKRVTYYPQLVLGLTFSWGALMGFPALGVDYLGAAPAAAALLGPDVASFLGLGLGLSPGDATATATAATTATTTTVTAAANTSPLAAAACLYLSNVCWTVFYDMIYARMDVRDDARAGIKSIALAHSGGAGARRVLALAAAAQVALLAGAGAAAGSGPAFFVAGCGGAAATLAWTVRRVDLASVRDCWWWFANGCWITGGAIAAGLGADYLLRYREAGARRGKDEEGEGEEEEGKENERKKEEKVV